MPFFHFKTCKITCSEKIELMLHLLNWNQNELESEWAQMGIENGNQNKLFI